MALLGPMFVQYRKERGYSLSPVTFAEAASLWPDAVYRFWALILGIWVDIWGWYFFVAPSKVSCIIRFAFLSIYPTVDYIYN